MELDEARTLKQQLGRYVTELMAERPRPAAAAAPLGVALGLAPRREGQFDVAVRYRLGTPTARMVARRVAGEVGPGVDVRRTGRIVPMGATRPRGPVPTAQAVGETTRVRPLRPGISVAHEAVSAGTLGAFVTVAGDDTVHALSNHHVLVGPRGQVGDRVLQPGPADGGRSPADRVGELSAYVPLVPGEVAHVDAALARLDVAEVDRGHPAGPLEGWGTVEGDEVVQKVGRTTGITEGRVTAIELDQVLVGYGTELGELRFDDQIEVESTGPGPFSRGGDSGSLVYRTTDRRAIGLLFAGSESGGENGTGLTYLNPVGEVLAALRATLL
ncbi:hypothetical protein PU560_15735 [Georgenia sp. 10Sc9-8]|uniref:Serine protease n=1 Tax=Georgenia halotolerans TaxID=3028317 RepID=A0ABT5U0R6_9MICO|nr:hypothetical protein [Georgenia halotolerans]